MEISGLVAGALSATLIALAAYGYWRYVWFFRNPPRSPPAGDSLIAAADGTVVYVRKVSADQDVIHVKKGLAARLVDIVREDQPLPNLVIGVFMSPFDVHYNRPIFKHNLRTSLTVGALAVQRAFGVTGAGVGVAVIDSGVATWHDDLTNHTTASYPYGDQRVSAFVDFVNSQALPYDDNGHGTHVSGIIAGNGHDSSGLNSLKSSAENSAQKDHTRPGRTCYPMQRLTRFMSQHPYTCTQRRPLPQPKPASMCCARSLWR